MNQVTLVPGDMVVFDTAQDGCTAVIVEGTPPAAPAATSFVTGQEARQLQKVQRVRNILKSHAVYLVVCTSPPDARVKRAMVIHPTGKLLLAETRFLRWVSG